MSFLTAVFARSDLQRELVAESIAAQARTDGATPEGVRVALEEMERLSRLARLSLRDSPLRAAWEVLRPDERSAVYSPTTASKAVSDPYGGSRA